MLNSRDALEGDSCPVQEELLGAMYRANEHGLEQLVEGVPPRARAMLALFCYRRSHLHSLAVAIASSCTPHDLVQIGGRVGSALCALSREIKVSRVASPSYGHRKPITLSTKPLSTFVPLEDEFDDVELEAEPIPA